MNGPPKELVRLITELNDDISQATISHWKKDELRTRCAFICFVFVWDLVQEDLPP